MSWPFWSFRTTPPVTPPSALPLDCESIEPLLPLYADGMAAPDEVRQVEAHLPGCEGCRESLFWMQATHHALASRPVAIPPTNLHSRIAEAIAASSAAPSLRPARSFTLRPAYAAAASLTALGLIFGYSLLHSPLPSVSVVTPAPPIVASVPPAPSKVKNVLPHEARVKPRQVLIARNAPAVTARPASNKSATAERVLAPKKTGPVNVIVSPDRVANNAPAPPHALAPVHVQVKPPVHPQQVLPSKLMASAKVPSAEKRQPTVPDTTTQKIASVPPPVAVDIKPPIVTTPEVRTIPSSPSNFLSGVNAYAKVLRDKPLAKTSLAVRQASVGATNAMHALDTEHSAYQPAVYTP